jgi:hypothetical protein
MPEPITTMNVMTDKPDVTLMLAVALKLGGTKPNKLLTRIKKNRVSKKGANRRACSPK